MWFSYNVGNAIDNVSQSPEIYRPGTPIHEVIQGEDGH